MLTNAELKAKFESFAPKYPEEYCTRLIDFIFTLFKRSSRENAEEALNDWLEDALRYTDNPYGFKRFLVIWTIWCNKAVSTEQLKEMCDCGKCLIDTINKDLRKHKLLKKETVWWGINKETGTFVKKCHYKWMEEANKNEFFTKVGGVIWRRIFNTLDINYGIYYWNEEEHKRVKKGDPGAVKKNKYTPLMVAIIKNDQEKLKRITESKHPRNRMAYHKFRFWTDTAYGCVERYKKAMEENALRVEQNKNSKKTTKVELDAIEDAVNASKELKTEEDSQKQEVVESKTKVLTLNDVFSDDKESNKKLETEKINDHGVKVSVDAHKDSELGYNSIDWLD